VRPNYVHTKPHKNFLPSPHHLSSIKTAQPYTGWAKSKLLSMSLQNIDRLNILLLAHSAAENFYTLA